MVAQDGHSSVCSIVGEQLSSNTVFRVSEGLELLLQGDGSIVGPEDFGSQTIHQLLKVFVQDSCREPIKEVITWVFVLHEQLQVLEHWLFHRYFVVIADRVFPEEVKLHHMLLPIQL